MPITNLVLYIFAHINSTYSWHSRDGVSLPTVIHLSYQISHLVLYICQQLLICLEIPAGSPSGTKNRVNLLVLQYPTYLIVHFIGATPKKKNCFSGCATSDLSWDIELAQL